VELVKNEKNWNPLLVDSQLDPFSNTKKERYKIPGKQEKTFRFVEQLVIEMQLEEHKLRKELERSGSTDNSGDEATTNKMSMQTMASEISACDQLPPELPEPLACSKHAQKTCFIKNPPHEGEGKLNSFTQRVMVERGKGEECSVEVEIHIKQASSVKFLASEIEGSTGFIWEGVMGLLEQGTILEPLPVF
jgi:hypothetical protein